MHEVNKRNVNTGEVERLATFKTFSDAFDFYKKIPEIDKDWIYIYSVSDTNKNIGEYPKF